MYLWLQPDETLRAASINRCNSTRKFD